MVVGQLKTLDRAGDRALAYGKAARDLFDAESGLQQWTSVFEQRPEAGEPCVFTLSKLNSH